MNTKLLTLLSFLLISCIADAQQYNKDSLQKVAAQALSMAPDTAKSRKLRELGQEWMLIDSAASKNLLEQALATATAIKNTDAITNSYRLLGIWYSTFNQQDKALDYYRASLQSAAENKHIYLMAGAWFNMANIKYFQSQYDSCIQFYQEAQKIYESPSLLNNQEVTEKMLDKRKSELYGNLSIIFSSLKNLKKADDYIDKAIAITQKYKSPAAEAGLAHFMQQKASNYFDNGQTAKALALHLQYLPVLQKNSYLQSELAQSYASIAKEYLALQKTDSATFFAQQSLALAQQIKTTDDMASANFILASIAEKQQQYQAAEKLLLPSSDYFEQDASVDEKCGYYQIMARINYAQARYKNAYEYSAKYNEAKDSLEKSERAKTFAERELRYETEKKDAQIKWQQSFIQEKNRLNYMLAGTSIALLLLVVLGYYNYRQKQQLQQQKITELQTEKLLMATEAVLKGEEQERNRLAKDLHDGLGGMLSGIKFSMNNMKGNLLLTAENAGAFERCIDMLDGSIGEMRRVAHNMMPEALVKFGLATALQDFCADINQSGALNISYQAIGLKDAVIDQTTAIAIYRIVQELINNTIKHAGAANAIVQISKSGNEISVTVEDDGRGFDPAILKQAKGIGWNNIENRVEFLKGKLDIHSAPGKGTSVLIELKV